jgi:prolyl oligopeptidase PreP (S9A serine peptidase family)
LFSTEGYGELPDASTRLNRLKRETNKGLSAYYQKRLNILAQIGRKDKKDSRPLDLPHQTLLEIAEDSWAQGLHDKQLYINMTRYLSWKPSFEETHQLAEGKKSYILVRKEALEGLKEANELELTQEFKKAIVNDRLELQVSGKARQLLVQVQDMDKLFFLTVKSSLMEGTTPDYSDNKQGQYQAPALRQPGGWRDSRQPYC